MLLGRHLTSSLAPNSRKNPAGHPSVVEELRSIAEIFLASIVLAVVSAALVILA